MKNYPWDLFYDILSILMHKLMLKKEVNSLKVVQVIVFDINCEIFFTNLHELFCQFLSWTNWVNSGKFMDNCWIWCQVMADMKNVYNNLMIINLYFAKLKYDFMLGKFVSQNGKKYVIHFAVNLVNF